MVGVRSDVDVVYNKLNTFYPGCSIKDAMCIGIMKKIHILQEYIILKSSFLHVLHVSCHY